MHQFASNKAFWKACLVDIEKGVANRVMFVTWFNNSAIIKIQGGVCVIGLSNIYAQEWILSRYHHVVCQVLSQYDPAIESVEYEVHESFIDPDNTEVFRIKKSDMKIKEDVKPSPRKLPNKDEVNIHGIRSKKINCRYSLKSFVVGQGTRLAHAACSAVSHKPGGNYNPLFIYGGVGLGKTHLLHATGNAILENFPHYSVVYTTAENFVNEIVEGIRTFKMGDIKKKYRNIDCLIIDDIQFLGSRERTQEEFFHTFDELYNNHKQIILSSDKSPRELKGIEDRLRSRFEMGMMVDVSAPDYETRLAILQMKSLEQQAIIPLEVLEFIAYNVQDNVRTLEGILMQAIAKAKLENTTPTVKMVGRYLLKFDSHVEIKGSNYDYVPEKGIARTVYDVIDIVSSYYRITGNDIKGDLRKREILRPRQLSMYLARKELNYSFEKIGTEFGGKNHTTVMHACDKIDQLLRKDYSLVRDVNAIKREMGL